MRSRATGRWTIWMSTGIFGRAILRRWAIKGLSNRNRRIMKHKFLPFMRQLIKQIGHLSSSLGSNVEIYHWFLRFQTRSITSSCRMISILTDIHNGFSLRCPILAKGIESSSKSSTNTNSTTFIKWEWRSSFILRDSLNKRIWVGTGEERISNTMRMGIAKVASTTSLFSH